MGARGGARAKARGGARAKAKARNGPRAYTATTTPRHPEVSLVRMTDYIHGSKNQHKARGMPGLVPF